MTFDELKNKILEQVKGRTWNSDGFNRQDEISFSGIAKLVQAELSNLPENCFYYRTNNKRMTVYFETYVAHKLIKYPLFELDVKTKRNKTIYSRWGVTTYDYIVNDLVVTPLTSYNGYADREHPDTATFIDFIMNLAKREAANNESYKEKAVESLKAVSAVLGTKDWTDLAQMLRYMRDNFSYIYDAGKINQ